MVFNKKMTIVGKLALCMAFFFAGLAVGYKTGIKTAPSQSTHIENNVKIKKGGSVNLSNETEQEQDNSKTKKKKKFLGIF